MRHLSRALPMGFVSCLNLIRQTLAREQQAGMLLEGRHAVAYGAGGELGDAAVFLTGRRLAPLDAVAREIRAAGGPWPLPGGIEVSRPSLHAQVIARPAV